MDVIYLASLVKYSGDTGDKTEKKTPEGPQNSSKKYVKTPARVMGNKGVYQPPQGKYSSGIGMMKMLF